MKLLTNHKVTINFLIDKPKEIVREEIIKLTKLHSTKEEVIELKLKPTFLDPSNGRGTIRFQLAQVDSGEKTSINCEIVPISFPKKAIYALSVILLIWTIVAALISLTFYSLLTITCGWTVLFIAVYLTRTLNQGKLENYVTMVIKNIKSVT